MNVPSAIQLGLSPRIVSEDFEVLRSREDYHSGSIVSHAAKEDKVLLWGISILSPDVEETVCVQK